MANKKHNKIKNVGVLFELLTRQITSDTINGIEKSPAISIVKEFFNKNSYLTKELNLYKALQKQKYKSETQADRFIELVIKEHSKISTSKLNRQKYSLIKEIKRNYKLEDFFKSHVTNYKLNASIYNLLESKNSKTIQNPSLLMKSRTFLTDFILEKHGSVKNTKDRIIKEYSKQDQDLRLLSYKILLEKFNSKYGKLSAKQKSLLKEYINNISNNSNLKKYIVNEVTIINKAIKLLNKKVDNNIVRIKLSEVQQQLSLIKKEAKMKDKHFVSILRSYDLIKELKNVVK